MSPSDKATTEAAGVALDAAEAKDVGDQVLLALVDLAREQAEELEKQNEALRRQNEALAQANRHKSEFLTTMSHELRTPLNAILGFSELLSEGIAGALTPGQAEYVGDIHRAGHNLLSMINDLLDLAKIEAGAMDFRRDLIDLCVPATQAADLVRAMATRKGQLLEVRADGPTACYGDAHRVRQIAINLLGNAVKFTPHGGSITATIRASDRIAELAVQDTGIGIDPSFHALIFEAFRQVDAGETREYQGTGLGLTLVSRFSAGMGGRVTVASAPGEGATFTLRLPAPPLVRPAGAPPLVGLLGAAAGGDELRALLAARGFEFDPLGPTDAFALREGTCAVLVDLDDPAVALRAVRRLRAAAAAPAVLALLRPAARGRDALEDAGAEVFRAEAGRWDALLERLAATAAASSPQPGTP